MNYVDKLSKGFLTSNTWVTNVQDHKSRWNKYEDPSYMGFYFKINPYGYYDPTHQDYDVLPQGLFLPSQIALADGAVTGLSSSVGNSPDSAENFLRRRGEYYRANMISEFRNGFLYVSEYEPWVFEKVTGVSDLWKADPKNPWRAKDKKLVFDCHESISMKMTYLIDCYRKASFDYNNMRYMLPDIQRYFSMDLYVTEIRDMKNANGSNFNTASFIRFRLDYCEFDFFAEDSASYMSELARYAPDKGASVKMTIKVGAIREINNYGLLGGMIGDTVYTWQRDKEVAGESFTQNTTIQGGGENQGILVDANNIRLSSIKSRYPPEAFKNPLVKNGGTGLGNNNLNYFSTAQEQFDAMGRTLGKGDFEGSTSNIQGQNMGTVPSDITPSQNLQQTSPINIDNDAPTPSVNLVSEDLGSVDLGAEARSLLSDMLATAFLGNVYGLSLTTLIGQLQNVLTDPIGTLQGLLSKFAKSPSEASTIVDNVQLSGADAKLLSDFIGRIKEIQSITAGTELNNATLGELAQLSPPTTSVINPPKQPLKSSGKNSLMGSPLGQILFGGSPIAKAAANKESLIGPDVKLTDDIDPNSASLNAPDINTQKDLGNVGFS